MDALTYTIADVHNGITGVEPWVGRTRTNEAEVGYIFKREIDSVAYLCDVMQYPCFFKTLMINSINCYSFLSDTVSFVLERVHFYCNSRRLQCHPPDKPKLEK